jgi:hypothetical protein
MSNWWLKILFKTQSYLTTDGQSASLSWYQATIWNSRLIFYILEIIFRYLRFFVLGRPLWQEDKSVICSYYWASPAQRLLDLSPSELMKIFHCLNVETAQIGGPGFWIYSPRKSILNPQTSTLNMSLLISYKFCLEVLSFCVHFACCYILPWKLSFQLSVRHEAMRKENLYLRATERENVEDTRVTQRLAACLTC